MITTVFKVIGYEMKTPSGDFMESCVFWVYAKAEKEALTKVKKFGVKKKFYQVMEVIEKEENAL